MDGTAGVRGSQLDFPLVSSRNGVGRGLAPPVAYFCVRSVFCARATFSSYIDTIKNDYNCVRVQCHVETSVDAAPVQRNGLSKVMGEVITQWNGTLEEEGKKSNIDLCMWREARNVVGIAEGIDRNVS